MIYVRIRANPKLQRRKHYLDLSIITVKHRNMNIYFTDLDENIIEEMVDIITTERILREMLY